MIAIRYTLLIGALLVFTVCSDKQSRIERDSATITGSPAGTDTLVTSAGTPVTNLGISDTSTTPGRVVRRYYEAIRAHDYDAAYVLWGQSGQASGKNRAAFAAGFAQTAQVRAIVSDSVQMEGAAGSQYATVPVVVDAVLRNGTAQHFEGTYTLRRAMVDGATPEQRRWHIYSADLKPR